MRALQPVMITFESREVHSDRLRRSWEFCVVAASGNDAGCTKQKGRKGSNMLKKLLGAAAMAASVYAFVPAHAAHFGIGCSGEDLARTEGAVEIMADGSGKLIAQREVAQAQDAMLNGKMGGCAMHLTRALQAGSLTQAPYAQAPYANTLAQAPYEATQQAPSQPQPGWQPLKAAQ
jgi:hypothetical protein